MLTLLPKRLIVYILDILYFQQGRQRNENIRILVLSRHRNVAGMDADAGVDPYSDGAGSSASTYHHHHNREGQCYYEFTVYLPLSTHRTYVLSTHVVRLGCKERWQNLCKRRCKIQTTFF